VDRKSGYYNKKQETMSNAARRRYQETWLRELVSQAWKNAPGVKRRIEAAGLTPRDLYSLDDLEKLSVLKKSALPELQRTDPPFGGFCTLPRSKLRRIFSSPGPIYEALGPEIGAWHSATGLYAGGFRPGDLVINTFAYHLTPAAHMFDEGLQMIGCAVVPTGVGNTDTQVTVAQALGVTGYVGTPSFLMTILNRAEEMGVGRLPFEVAQVAAEALPESLRSVFEERYGIMTRQGFGTAELGIVAYECREKSGMHLVDDAIVQVCNPVSGEPLQKPAPPELVVTVNHRAFPMIRFGTGDLTIISNEKCPCGRTSARMLGWRGRTDELTKVRGIFIHPRLADEAAARVSGVSRYQVVVTRKDHLDELVFRVELAGAAAGPAVAAGLTRAIRDVMKLRGDVEVVPPGSIPDGAKKILDQRKWE